MKLYQPPTTSGTKFTPSAKLNPWYNGEIVTQSQVSAHSSKFLEKEMVNNHFAKHSATNHSIYNTVTASEGGL